MKKTSPDSPSFLDRVSFGDTSKAHGNPSHSADSRDSTIPVSNSTTTAVDPEKQSNKSTTSFRDDTANIPTNHTNHNGLAPQRSHPTSSHVADNTSNEHPPPAPPPQTDGEGNIIGTPEDEKPKNNVAMRFWLTTKHIILSSYVNILLVFVPVGIAVYAAGLSPGLIFAMNAIAIIPLAGLLSHATESVAKRMGDTVGALMNVTFGNAVELIIFMYVYLNEIRIVQASLLGSILANLLLILGMCFLVGGLRFREQIYNSTVTQMSACLLSLSVMSLLLPTAFHASFSSDQEEKATNSVLKVSRGTSVVLLLVYFMYLLFQLKSHAYMYESTPQHIIDEESAPGPVAAWMDTSSDDSSSSSDSDSSSGSNTTAKRVKRLIRGGRRRKSSSASKDTSEVEAIRKSSFGNSSISPAEGSSANGDHAQSSHRSGAVIDFAEDGDDERPRRSRQGSFTNYVMTKKEQKRERKQQKKEKRERKRALRHQHQETIMEGVVRDANNEKTREEERGSNQPRRVDFAIVDDVEAQQDGAAKRPFTLRRITSIRPQIPKPFAQNVFTNPATPEAPPPGSIPRVRYGIRRTNSLPDRLNQTMSNPNRLPSSASLAPIRVGSAAVAVNKVPMEDDDENISRTTAVFLLLISTGLVAVCAEFMVDSINAVVSGNSGLSEAFIGLIILPIVGNAAEHVTAVTVASKNKMDLAIGVAVGSSIQIALFVTPFIVLLGWCMSRDMSLYFTLFETVSLFVSAFIVNFLVLDGRSNYLEGALLCAAYVIIAVAAFFYPGTDDQSNLGGNPDAEKMIRSLVGM